MHRFLACSIREKLNDQQGGTKGRLSSSLPYLNHCFPIKRSQCSVSFRPWVRKKLEAYPAVASADTPPNHLRTIPGAERHGSTVENVRCSRFIAFSLPTITAATVLKATRSPGFGQRGVQSLESSPDFGRKDRFIALSRQGLMAEGGTPKP